jgi:Na+-driven multidrug efflux pump
MNDAETYMRVITGGLIAVSLYHAGFSALRAFGDSKTPLYFMIGANVLNVGLDLLFVITFKMGVFGAAIATVLSQLIAAACCIIYAFRTFPYFKKALSHLKPNKRLIVQVLKIALPSGFQYSLVFLSSSALQRVINGFGESVIGAFTATSRIEALIEQPFAGLGSAIVTYTGQNIGAGRFDRVKQGIRVAAKAVAVYSAVLLILFWTAGNAIMRIFVDDTTIISTAATGIRSDNERVLYGDGNVPDFSKSSQRRGGCVVFNGKWHCRNLRKDRYCGHLDEYFPDRRLGNLGDNRPDVADYVFIRVLAVSL